VLIQQRPASFAEENQFEYLADDGVALNRTVGFRVETFEPREDFTPTKPFRTRLKWRDPASLDQSKLLMIEPMSVAALILKSSNTESMTPRSGRPRGRSRRPRDPCRQVSNG
jgi:hypothetical protein